MNRICFCLLIIILSAGHCMIAQETHLQLNEEANALYLKANYQEAIDKYQEVESLGFESSSLYFNRARAHFQLKENVLALIYLERCLKISPRHEEAIVARKEIINQLENPIVSYNEESMKQLWNGWFHFLSANTWSYLFIISLLIFLLINYLGLKSILRIPFVIKLLTGILCLLFFINAWSISTAETSRDFGLVKVLSAEIFSTADLESTVKNEVTEAQKLKVLDQIAEWYKIQLPNRETGWILKDHLIII